MNQNNNLLSAKALSRLGFYVVPLHTPHKEGCSCANPTCRSPGKHPRPMHGLNDASLDERQIEAWWSTWPDANVGIATGARSKLVVVDIDPRNGGASSLRALEQHYGALPGTAQSLTGGGGRHLFFQHPGFPVANSAGQLGDGIDLKGDQGLIVAPPSLHASGVRYEWLEGYGIETTSLFPLPKWIVGLTRESGETRSPRSLRKLTALGAVEGSRNHSVASLTGHLLRKNVDIYAVVELVLAWNRARNVPPLDDDEVLKTIESIAKSELARRAGGAR